MIERDLGVIRISLPDVLAMALERPEGTFEKETNEELRNGRIPRDEVCLALLEKRIQQADCIQNGYVLDGFPQNIKQANLLKTFGIIPTDVLYMKMSDY